MNKSEKTNDKTKKMKMNDKAEQMKMNDKAAKATAKTEEGKKGKKTKKSEMTIPDDGVPYDRGWAWMIVLGKCVCVYGKREIYRG